MLIKNILLHSTLCFEKQNQMNNTQMKVSLACFALSYTCQLSRIMLEWLSHAWGYKIIVISHTQTNFDVQEVATTSSQL